MDNHDQAVKEKVSQLLNAPISEFLPIGAGGQAKAYRATLQNGASYAVKLCPVKRLVEEEYENLRFLKETARASTPEPLGVFEADGEYGLVMEYYDGVSAANVNWKRVPEAARRNFARCAVENLLQIQSAVNDKFGEASDPRYDRWVDYYRPFTENVLSFLRQKTEEKRFGRRVLSLMERAAERFDEIFADCSGTSVLTHGDYWMPNFIVRESDFKFLGAVDPFHLLYAEPEYELFALSVGMERGLPFLEEYETRRPLSEKFSLKLEFYAIFSEGYWYMLTDKHIPSFFRYKARLLKRQLKKFNLYR